MKRNNNFKATYTPPADSPSSSSSESAVSFTSDGRKVIKFYGERNAYGCFSNFSAHPILLHGKQWPVRPPLPPPLWPFVFFTHFFL
jgi:hypothetical protein